MGRFGRRGIIQRLAVQAVLVEEVVQSRQADTNVPSGFDKIEQVITGSVGMGDQEMRNRPDIARQEFSVGSAGESVLNLTDDLPRREIVLPRRGGPGDAHESCHLGQLQAQLAVQEKMTDDTATGIISAGLLEKDKRRLQDRESLRRPLCPRNLRLVQPLFESFPIRGILRRSPERRACEKREE